MQLITCRMKPHVVLKIVIFNTICIILVTYLSSYPIYANNDITVIPSSRTGSKYDEIHETLKKVTLIYGNIKQDDGDDDTDRKIGEEEIKVHTYESLNTNPEYRRRLLQAYAHCFGKPPGVARRVMVDKRKTSAVCIVPKVGCTHWINVFRFLNNETGGFVYRKPEDIPRLVTHFAPKGKEYHIFPNSMDDVNYSRKISFLKDSFRFMFVRHPIQRLWSAWVDKFFLPDFWFSEGHRVVKHLNLTAKHHKCPTEITFHDFLRYVTHPYYREWPGDANEHWSPMEHQCDPCVFYPHLIGKMETFGEDSKVAMSIMNTESHPEEETRKRSNQTGNDTKTQPGGPSEADGVWLNTSYHGDRAVHEMRMLTDYNIDLVTGKYFRRAQKGCRVSKAMVLKRLWKAFQYNGYIKSDIPFDLFFFFFDLNMQDWHKALFRAYSAWPDDKGIRTKQQKSQKEKVIRIMYKNIPQDLLSEIHKMFKNDFSQFGYAFEPYTD